MKTDVELEVKLEAAAAEVLLNRAHGYPDFMLDEDVGNYSFPKTLAQGIQGSLARQLGSGCVKAVQANIEWGNVQTMPRQVWPIRTGGDVTFGFKLLAIVFYAEPGHQRMAGKCQWSEGQPPRVVSPIEHQELMNPRDPAAFLVLFVLEEGESPITLVVDDEEIEVNPIMEDGHGTTFVELNRLLDYAWVEPVDEEERTFRLVEP